MQMLPNNDKGTKSGREGIPQRLEGSHIELLGEDRDLAC